jgi:hypothetical protein
MSAAEEGYAHIEERIEWLRSQAKRTEWSADKAQRITAYADEMQALLDRFDVLEQQHTTVIDPPHDCEVEI